MRVCVRLRVDVAVWSTDYGIFMSATVALEDNHFSMAKRTIVAGKKMLGPKPVAGRW